MLMLTTEEVHLRLGECEADGDRRKEDKKLEKILIR